MTRLRMSSCTDVVQEQDFFKRCFSLPNPENNPFTWECQEHKVIASRCCFWNPTGFPQAGYETLSCWWKLSSQQLSSLCTNTIYIGGPPFPPSSKHRSALGIKSHRLHFWPYSAFKKGQAWTIKQLKPTRERAVTQVWQRITFMNIRRHHKSQNANFRETLASFPIQRKHPHLLRKRLCIALRMKTKYLSVAYCGILWNLS